MKVAKFSIYSSFIIFLLTILASEVNAKESVNLRISGLIPSIFEIDISTRPTSFVVNSSSNFDFFGFIEFEGVKILQGEEITLNQNLNYKLVTVSIN